MNISCPVCGAGSAFAFHSRFRSVRTCVSESCGHLFVADPGSGAGVETHPRIDCEWDDFARRDRRLVDYLVRRLGLGPSARVLDFGSGAGHLAAALRRRLGHGSVVCVEADEATVSELRRRNLDAVQTLDESPGGFDAILAIEVIEHVPDPMAVLSDLAARLRKGGVLFITTPSGEIRRGGLTSAYDNPSHIHFFTPRSVRVALKRAGYGHVDFRVIDAMYPRETGIHAIRSFAKTVGRPIRARLFGPTHLTGFAYAADTSP